MIKGFSISIPKFRLRKRVVLLFWLLVLGAGMAFVNKRQNLKLCQHIEVEIDRQKENYFIEEADVIDLLTLHGKEDIVGSLQEEIDLKKLENRIKAHGFVEDAKVSTGLNGDLLVEVTQAKPLIRLSAPSVPDVYVSTEGKILPLSDRFTPRVMILSGPLIYKLRKLDWKQDTLAKPYFHFVETLLDQEFYKVMFYQADINWNGSLTLYPQIGSMQVEWGQPDELEKKFKKLDILYEDIVPKQGWGTYRRASLQFNQQIICE